MGVMVLGEVEGMTARLSGFNSVSHYSGTDMPDVQSC